MDRNKWDESEVLPYKWAWGIVINEEAISPSWRERNSEGSQGQGQGQAAVADIPE